MKVQNITGLTTVSFQILEITVIATMLVLDGMSQKR